MIFLNDEDQYLEVELSPYGSYLLTLFDRYRNSVFLELPLPSLVRAFKRDARDEMFNSV